MIPRHRYGNPRNPILTSFVYPPIPIRSFDWSAVRNDYDGAPDSRCLMGTGASEMEAIADLLEQEWAYA